MKIRHCLLLTLIPTGILLAQSAAPPALYGSDALGRALPDPSQVRAFRADRYVGVFYFLWLRLNQVHDNSKILAQHPEAEHTNASPPWGPKNAFHFWGEPMYGYYRSEDPWVLRRHAALLSDAGVDFLIFDTTNAVIYENVVRALCKVFDEQRRLGEHVPQITFMVNTRAGQTAQRIYERLHQPNLYPELWFRWQGKPLLICDPNKAPPKVKSFYTLRKAHWPFELVNTHNAWHWEATYPQVYSYDNDPNKPEQVNVSVGQNLHQETGRVAMMSSGQARGRSFHGGRVDTRPHAYRYGFNFQEQWQRAFKLDPEVVFVTGWNEWIAMQLNTKESGRPVFCDQYNLEMSRDVEMMRGGYRDNYYLQMAANIRRYKGMAPAPAVSSGKTIGLDSPFLQWDDITPIYRDHALDTLPRDHAGCGTFHYRNYTGRNDLRILKVTHDRNTVCFYAETADDISPVTDPNWMWLLIGLPDVDAPNWEGFHFLVNRRVGNTDASLEVCVGGWNWRPVGEVSFRVMRNRLHLLIPKVMLGLPTSDFTLDFKWIDNAQHPGDIMDVYLHGDAAPEGRFRYRYKTGNLHNPFG